MAQEKSKSVPYIPSRKPEVVFTHPPSSTRSKNHEALYNAGIAMYPGPGGLILPTLNNSINISNSFNDTGSISSYQSREEGELKNHLMGKIGVGINNNLSINDGKSDSSSRAEGQLKKKLRREIGKGIKNLSINDGKGNSDLKKKALKQIKPKQRNRYSKRKRKRKKTVNKRKKKKQKQEKVEEEEMRELSDIINDRIPGNYANNHNKIEDTLKDEKEGLKPNADGLDRYRGDNSVFVTVEMDDLSFRGRAGLFPKKSVADYIKVYHTFDDQSMEQIQSDI